MLASSLNKILTDQLENRMEVIGGGPHPFLQGGFWTDTVFKDDVKGFPPPCIHYLHKPDFIEHRRGLRLFYQLPMIKLSTGFTDCLKLVVCKECQEYFSSLNNIVL
jgi:hypothetical protein